MLKTRALSALVLAPPVLAALWWGGYAFAALVALAAAIMAWEWHGIVAGRFAWSGRVAAVAGAGACLLAVADPLFALALVLGGAAVSAFLAKDDDRPLPRPWLWAGCGALYAGLPAVALVWLRGGGDGGRAVLLWLMLVVWATDIGAYGFGRAVGGPLLAPAISPKKTWAGLLGGMLCAAGIGVMMAAMVAVGSPVAVAMGSAVLAVIAQAGDLLESWVKRRFGVKDASSIIPGHGGVLDRVDGLLAAGIAVALATLATGSEVLNWHW